MRTLRPAIAALLMAANLPAQETPAPTPKPSPAAPVPPPAPPLSLDQLIDRLDDAEISAAIEKLRVGFLDPGAASEQGLRRAALRGLIARWSPGIELDPPDAPPQPAPHSFLAEILDSHIAYVRPGSLGASSLAQLDATIEGFKGQGVDALILDLRAVAGGEDFEAAANFARRFIPKGKVLFSLQRPAVRQERIFTSSQDPAFDGLLVVLVDSRTSGAAEALAATLRENTGAMIAGADTAGAAVEYEPLKLGNGSVLRMAVARAALPGR
ncbi:MAG: S41 family peptidase, partial [Terrimicrobiaceae bacterium]|nr:S41 family peptidase [Terrimicrobiaceae bacterium]